MTKIDERDATPLLTSPPQTASVAGGNTNPASPTRVASAGAAPKTVQDTKRGQAVTAGAATPGSTSKSSAAPLVRPPSRALLPAQAHVPVKPENRHVTQPIPQTSQVAPVTWAVEALRIDLAAETRKRRRRFLSRMFIFVVLPTLVSAAYVFWYASPRYVSEFQITYQTFTAPGSSSGSSSSMISGIASSLMGGGSGGSVDYSRILYSYLSSDAILRQIEGQLHLRAHYSDPRIDWLDRLPTHASEEEFLDYFRRRINVDDMMGGYLIVDVEGFDPKFAAVVASTMLNAADEMFDKLTLRQRQEEVRIATQELKKTQDHLVQATAAVTNFRNQHRDFNPATMVNQLDTVVGGLEAQLSQAHAELNRDRSFLNAKSPQIYALTTQIAALEQQIEAEKHRLATTDGAIINGNSPPSTDSGSTRLPYSTIVEAYTALELEVKFATDSYLSAKQSYDLSRMNAASQQNFVENFVAPNVPQESTSPDPWTYIPATFLACLALYSIGSLLTGTFREQVGT